VWQKPLKKCVFVLCVDNYAPAITALTYPLLKHYAKKIGAEFHVIKERKFPEFAPVYEKLQIYELAQEMQNDWNIYIDSDTLVHPDLFDITCHIPRDTVIHHGNDMASVRWTYDRFFRRDGRNIGSCNWFTAASDWCIELWKPLDDITHDEALANIHPIVNELNTVVKADHLIDDYTLSRNIAKYGLKFNNLMNIMRDLGFNQPGFFWHEYTITNEEKVVKMKKVLKDWQIA
jgi:hypothetical protein